MIHPLTIEELEFVTSNYEACRGIAIHICQDLARKAHMRSGVHHAQLRDGRVELVLKQHWAHQEFETTRLQYSEATLFSPSGGKGRNLPCRPGFYKEQRERKEAKKSTRSS